VLAAGLIALSGWDKQSTLLDPMCGSGTILIEADRIARNVPPQYADREFGFKRWKTFDNELWEKIVKDCDSNIKSSGPSILGYDKNLRALKVSEQNIDEADAWDHIKVEKKDFFKSSAHEPLTIITNPPYELSTWSASTTEQAVLADKVENKMLRKQHLPLFCNIEYKMEVVYYTFYSLYFL